MSRLLKFANKNAIQNNPIAVMLYLAAVPIAVSFKKIGLSPNYVTLLSLVFSLCALGALALENLLWFLFFWFLAYLLDFVDGTLARMTGQVGKSALRVDHITDLIKISAIFLGFSLFYEDTLIKVLSFVSATGYLFYTTLNHELDWVSQLSSHVDAQIPKSESVACERPLLEGLKSYIKSRRRIKKIALSFLSILQINGHTLLIFFLIPVNYYFAVSLLLYFIFIVILQSLLRMRSLNSMPKINILKDEEKI